MWRQSFFLFYLAATAVVIATAIITATVVGIATTAVAVTVTAEQNEDYKDDNPAAVITVVEKATHSLNPLSMHNMMFKFFCYKKNIYLLKEQNKSEISLKGGVKMGYSFDYDKYKKHRPSDIRDLISEEYDYDFADEFDYIFGDYDDFDEDNEF